MALTDENCVQAQIEAVADGTMRCYHRLVDDGLCPEADIIDSDTFTLFTPASGEL